jgi:hypothetical protein
MNVDPLLASQGLGSIERQGPSLSSPPHRIWNASGVQAAGQFFFMAKRLEREA